MIYLRPQDVVEIIMRVSSYGCSARTAWAVVLPNNRPPWTLTKPAGLLITLNTTKVKDTKAGTILPDFFTLA